MKLCHKVFLACVAALAGAAVTVRANDIVFTFRGEVTGVAHPDTTDFQVGDAFTVALDFTPDGPTPALGYYVNAGARSGSAQGIHNYLRHGESTWWTPGQGPPYWDNFFANFSDPWGYQKYCYSYATLTDGVLSFGMFDEGVGPWGWATVGPEFPSSWIGDMRSPLPGGVDRISFAASGSFFLNYMNVGGANLTGTITGGSVECLRQLGYDHDGSDGSGGADIVPDPVPEPATAAWLAAGVAGLLWRRRGRR